MNKATALALLEEKANEIWKPLYEYKNYALSNYGRIKTIERIMSIGIRNGQEHFRLKEESIKALRTNNIEPFLFTDIYFRDEKGVQHQKTIYVHKAVADHFVEKPNYIIEYEKAGGHICASHIIKDYTNNRFDNVKWQTQVELIQNQPNRDYSKNWIKRRKLYGSSGSRPKKIDKIEVVEYEII